MELAEDDIPKPVSLDLLAEDFLFCFAESDVVTISFYDLMTVPFAYPVADIVADHRTECCKENSPDDMRLAPESSYQYHHVHPRYRSPDDRHRLDTRTRECDEIVPVPECLDQDSDPLDPWFDPLWLRKSEHEQSERENSKKYGDDFCEEYSKSFESVFHSLIVSEKLFFAKGKLAPCPGYKL